MGEKAAAKLPDRFKVVAMLVYMLFQSCTQQIAL